MRLVGSMSETLARRAVPPASGAIATTGSRVRDRGPGFAPVGTLPTSGGGIIVQGEPWGMPAGTLLLLAIGTLLASRMGTTGAAPVLIHPSLRANAPRRRKVHRAGRIIASLALDDRR